ncbi:CD70 antigen [Manis javanica]|uniref:CD70 antigen n=1 Tax=Manis javanica TaxID=9974 RepID=UPI000813B1DC|nr:CD70 antigen [Manis javanica]
MQRRPRAPMAEEGSGCQVPRLPWAPILRVALPLVLVAVLVYCFLCSQHLAQQRRQRESPGGDIAELQLNHTGRRQDSRLHWQGGPALGRSFMHGPELHKGQLRVQRNGIYRLHIQVTLTNCSSSARTARPRGASLAVGICSPAARSVSLLRLGFQQRCAVASQRLTPLLRGDTLCTNLSLPLLPSRNADETFFGVQWVHP